MKILAFYFLLALALPQTAKPTLPGSQNASPEIVVKDFYRWYIDRLNKNKDPLRQEKVALGKYLTPECLRKAARTTDADELIQAQDWDPDWGKNVTVSNLKIQGTTATLNATLSGKIMDKQKLKIRLKQTNGMWKIDRVDALDL